MVKQYPYDARFLLAPIAVFLLGVGESIGTLGAASWGRATAVGRTLAVLACVPPVYRVIAFPPPYQWSVAGAYLAQIRQRWQLGDALYTTYGTALEVLYVAPRFGIAARDVILGPCAFGDPRATLRAVDALRGRRRAWVIVGSGRYAPLSPEYGYLRTIGLRRDSLAVRLPGSIRIDAPDAFDIPTAYLFDLSDSTRLARATAESYAISPHVGPLLRRIGRRNCYGVWSPGETESVLRRQPSASRTQSARPR